MLESETCLVAASLRKEADDLWEGMEDVARQPTIRPIDVIALAGRTAGFLRGLAEAVDWYANHQQQEVTTEGLTPEDLVRPVRRDPSKAMPAHVW